MRTLHALCLNPQGARDRYALYEIVGGELKVLWAERLGDGEAFPKGHRKYTAPAVPTINMGPRVWAMLPGMVHTERESLPAFHFRVDYLCQQARMLGLLWDDDVSIYTLGGANPGGPHTWRRGEA